MTIRKADVREFPDVQRFYWNLIDDMEGWKYHPRWQKGIYPDDQYLRSSLERGELFVALGKDGEYMAAMVLNQKANDGYEKASWPSGVSSSEALLIHTLGVGEKYLRRGLGKAMVEKAFSEATLRGLKAVRLDVLQGNDPAEALYGKLDFVFVGSVELYYEDTGLCLFNLFEKVL